MSANRTVLQYLYPYEHCDTCGKRNDNKKQLKRCKGCSAVMYCSKECQKASWHKHK